MIAIIVVVIMINYPPQTFRDQGTKRGGAEWNYRLLEIVENFKSKSLKSFKYFKSTKGFLKFCCIS